jgi:hypothetical protein
MDGCRTFQPATQQVSTVLQQTWSGCVNGSAVALYLVQGAGHVWPPYGPGAPTNYSASAAIWKFFSNIQAAPTSAGAVSISSLQVSVQKHRHARTIVASFTLGEAVKIVETLAGRIPVHGSFSLATSGRPVSQLSVPRGVKAGKYTLTFAISDSYGRTLSLSRTIRLPAA